MQSASGYYLYADAAKTLLCAASVVGTKEQASSRVVDGWWKDGRRWQLPSASSRRGAVLYNSAAARYFGPRAPRQATVPLPSCPFVTFRSTRRPLAATLHSLLLYIPSTSLFCIFHLLDQPQRLP